MFNFIPTILANFLSPFRTAEKVAESLEKAGKPDSSRLLRHEELERIDMISGAVVCMAAGAGAAAFATAATVSGVSGAVEVAEYRNCGGLGSLGGKFAQFEDARLDISLGVTLTPLEGVTALDLAVSGVYGDPSVDELFGQVSPSLMPSDLALTALQADGLSPQIENAIELIIAKPNNDAIRQFGNDMLLVQISSMDANRILSIPALQTPGGAAFDQQAQADFWAGIGNLGNMGDQSGPMPTPTGAIMPLTMPAGGLEPGGGTMSLMSGGGSGGSGGSGGWGGSGGSGGSGGWGGSGGSGGWGGSGGSGGWGGSGSCAISSLHITNFEWSAGPDAHHSSGSGGGSGIFADRAPGQGVGYNHVRVSMTATNYTSSNVVVTIAAMDIFNALYTSQTLVIAESIGGDFDNHGEIGWNSQYTVTAGSSHAFGSTMVFAPGTSTLYVKAIVVGAHAGDNWVFRAYDHTKNPNAISGGGSLHRDTEALTAWRRLWVEIDQMYIPSGFTGPNNMPLPYREGLDQLADAPILGAHLKSEFAKACIQVKPFTPNTHPQVAGDLIVNHRYNDEFSNWKSDGWRKYSASRESQNQNTDSFWSVLAVGAFGIEPIKIGTETYTFPGAYHGNVAYVFNDVIAAELTGTSYLVAQEVVLLHELGHAFGQRDVIGPSIMGLGTFALATHIDNGWISFTTDQLRGIQKHGKPS